MTKKWKSLFFVIVLCGIWPSQVGAQSDINARLDQIERKIDRLLALQETERINFDADSFLNQVCDGDRLDKQFFTVCHVRDWKISRWVGYHLTEENLNGKAKRKNNFRPDPQLARGSRSELTDYRNSGFDRGHMAPAAAFKRSKQAMSTTFLLSNMAPQTAQLNRNKWRLLEEDVRTLARDHGDVWVFTGNLFLNSNEQPTSPQKTIGSNKVAVPTHCFKTILLRSNEQRWQMFAFLMPNQRSPIPGSVEDYQVTVDRIETLAGIDFFSGLPDGLEHDLERTTTSWPIGT